MADVSRLQAHLHSLGRVLLGYSGGVDSAFLAVAGARALPPGRLLAVIGRSASYPEEQYRTALTLAQEFGVPVREIATREMEDPRYRENPVNRCYFCKTELWQRLAGLAEAEGFDAIIDGSNADDGREHRPGLRAGREWRIGSPLAELGWTKADVRAAARELGLPTWNAPAAPCLSSRIRYGVPVTAERLGQVEAGEALLRRLGVAGNLRVRHLGNAARIEVEPDQMALVRRHWNHVTRELARLGLGAVELDPAGYRRGSLLVLSGASA